MFAFLNALTRTTSGKAFRVHVVCKIRGQVRAKKRKNQYRLRREAVLLHRLIGTMHKTNKEWN